MKLSSNPPPKQSWTNTDYYSVLTNYCIKQLQNGIIPWRKSVSIPFYDFAQNYYSSRVYRGINWLLLNLVHAQKAPYYLTPNQVQKLGGSIPEETKPYSVFSFHSYYQTEAGTRLAKVQVRAMEARQEPFERVSFWKRHQLIHIDQTHNIVWEHPQNRFPRTANEILRCMQEKPKIKYYELGESYYDPKADEIIFPSAQQKIDEDPYVLFVNLMNWTGHSSRLGRPGIVQAVNDCHHDVLEQLVSDMGASFFCRLVQAPLPFQVHHESSTDILDLWIQTLEEDNRFLFRAASHVQQAVEYILQ